MPLEKNLPIGIFDSGVGGLTVMRQLAHLLPNEDLIYLGDTARVPYGTRSPEVVRKYTLEATDFLLEKKIKLLIVACHTASSHSLEILQEKHSIPVIGVVHSGFEELMQSGVHQRVAILGTQSTIGSGLYQNLIHQKSAKAECFPVACPLFVPLIEEGLLDHPITEQVAEYYLQFLRPKQIDAALLACTHYPLIRPIIQQVLGLTVTLIEPAEAVARKALQCLSHSQNLNSQKTKSHMQFFATDDPNKFIRMAKFFFGSEVKEVTKANLFS